MSGQQLHWLSINPWLTDLQAGSHDTKDTVQWHHSSPAILRPWLPTDMHIVIVRQLLLSVPWMVTVWLAKAFSVSRPFVWNSMSYNCRFAEYYGVTTENLVTLTLAKAVAISHNIFKALLTVREAHLCIDAVHLFVCLFVCLSVAKIHTQKCDCLKK